MKSATIAEIQQKLLEIVTYFDSFCTEHGITYYLMGGSALGARRHGGFIPWDDDLDVFLTYDNYRKLINAFRKNIDAYRFYFQEENTEEWPMYFSKLRLNGTTFIEEDTRYRKMHKGLYIDVMCLNNVSSRTVFRYFQYVAARILTSYTLMHRGYQTNSILKKAFMLLSTGLVNIGMKNILVRFVRCLNNTETAFVGHLFGRAKFKNTSFPKYYLGEQRYVQFSNTMLPVPNQVEKYLELRYGKKFMEMPDENTKSLYPSHAAFVDLDNHYSKYEKHKN